MIWFVYTALIIQTQHFKSEICKQKNSWMVVVCKYWYFYEIEYYNICNRENIKIVLKGDFTNVLVCAAF